MTRRRPLTIVLSGLVPALAVGLVLQRAHERRDGRERDPARLANSAAPDLRPSSYAQAAAGNYKLLSPRQSRRLIAFAGGLSACLRKRGIGVEAPKASRTRIRLVLPSGAPRQVVLSRAIACGDMLGGPPPGRRFSSGRR